MMMKKIKVYALLVCLLATSAAQAQSFGSAAMRKLQMAEFAISNFYVDKVDEDKLVEEAIIKMLAQLDPHSVPIVPTLFITIACGAVSGFHATQSPMMARWIKNERMGRRVFYGAMITEGIVAMIWAAAAIKYAGGYDELQQKGDKTPYAQILAETKQRDKQDSERAIAPLKPAPDAVKLDTSGNTIEQSVSEILAIIRRKLG